MNGNGIQPTVELATNNGNGGFYPYPLYPMMGNGGNGGHNTITPNGHYTGASEYYITQ